MKQAENMPLRLTLSSAQQSKTSPRVGPSPVFHLLRYLLRTFILPPALRYLYAIRRTFRVCSGFAPLFPIDSCDKKTPGGAVVTPSGVWIAVRRKRSAWDATLASRLSAAGVWSGQRGVCSQPSQGSGWAPLPLGMASSRGPPRRGPCMASGGPRRPPLRIPKSSPGPGRRGGPCVARCLSAIFAKNCFLNSAIRWSTAAAAFLASSVLRA